MVSPDLIKAHVAKYASADDARAWREVAETAVGLVVFTWLWLHFWNNPILWFVFTVLTSLTWTRTFIIFHDCAHFSFFSTPAANQRMAFVCGAWGVTPYERWRRNHNRHHKIFGDLDQADSGQTIFFTKQQYAPLPPPAPHVPLSTATARPSRATLHCRPALTRRVTLHLPFYVASCTAT
jgi:omega-6 fatty acid desaturase (delta-12 desaturase)